MSEWPKTVQYHLHSDKESNFAMAAEIGLTDESTVTFVYTCYEIELRLEVHKNGESYITHVGNVSLTSKVKA